MFYFSKSVLRAYKFKHLNFFYKLANVKKKANIYKKFIYSARLLNFWDGSKCFSLLCYFSYPHRHLVRFNATNRLFPGWLSRIIWAFPRFFSFRDYHYRMNWISTKLKCRGRLAHGLRRLPRTASNCRIHHSINISIPWFPPILTSSQIIEISLSPHHKRTVGQTWSLSYCAPSQAYQDLLPSRRQLHRFEFTRVLSPIAKMRWMEALWME